MFNVLTVQRTMPKWHHQNKFNEEPMLTTVEEILSEKSNDYTHHEHQYQAIAGSELVLDPLTSPTHGLNEIGLSVSVIIPAWNARHTIERCLTALEHCSFNYKFPESFEVIVVDDGSTDGTWEYLATLHLDLNFTLLQQAHHSRAYAMNTGISHSSGDVVVSCDADMILTPFSGFASKLPTNEL